MDEKFTWILWRDVSNVGSQDGPHYEELSEALDKFGDEHVLLLRLPYGQKIIRNGQFDWGLLPEPDNWRKGYGTDVAIPFAMVKSKVVELYDIIEHKSLHKDGQDYDIVCRSIPSYLVMPGEFFGLFENFAPQAEQTPVRATAGGTTLLALPPIGTDKLTKKFALQFTDEITDDDRDHLKHTTSSNMDVGSVFAKMLKGKTDWRAEIIVFPAQFLKRIRRSSRARDAILRITLDQLSLALKRASRSITAIQRPLAHSIAKASDVQALRLIADGCRPGFTPVLESPADELVLPAGDLHDLIWTSEVKLDPTERFPIFFRPSLPGEVAYYFLKRPFFPGVGLTGNAAACTAATLDAANKGNPKRFWLSGEEHLHQTLATEAPPSRREIKVQGMGSYFLTQGVIACKTSESR